MSLLQIRYLSDTSISDTFTGWKSAREEHMCILQDALLKSLRQCFGSGFNQVSDPDPETGSGSRRAKMTHKNRK
jgi:hypothetical protein